MKSSPLSRPLIVLITGVMIIFVVTRLLLMFWAWKTMPTEVHDYLDRYWLVSSLVGASVLLMVALVANWYFARLRRFEKAKARSDGLAEIGLLAGGLAHEIRNPLNAMRTHLSLLRRRISSGDEEAAQKKVNQLDEATQHLEELVTDFLTYARPVEDALEEHDPATLVGEVLEFVEIDLEQAGVKTVTDFDPDMPKVQVDGDKLKRALLNLIINARQAMPEGGTITITGKATEQGWAGLEIADTGTGIAPKDQSRIFETFFSTKRKGTGLGLSVVKRTIEDSGGRISVTTEPGRGATFRIELPGVLPLRSRRRANQSQAATG